MTTTTAPDEMATIKPENPRSGLTFLFEKAAQGALYLVKNFPKLAITGAFVGMHFLTEGASTAFVADKAASLAGEGVALIFDQTVNTIDNTIGTNIGPIVDVTQMAVNDASDNINAVRDGIGAVATPLIEDPMGTLTEAMSSVKENGGLSEMARDSFVETMSDIEDNGGLVEVTKDGFTDAFKQQLKTFAKYALPFMEHYSR